MDAVLAKARALERLRTTWPPSTIARAPASGDLRDEARASATTCDRLAGAVAIEIDLRDSLAE